MLRPAWRLLCLPLLFTIVLSGCTPTSEAAVTEVGGTSTPTVLPPLNVVAHHDAVRFIPPDPPVEPENLQALPSKDVRLTFAAPSVARVGESVTFTVSLQNIGDALGKIRMGPGAYAGGAFDLVVTTRDGQVVWSFLHRKIIVAIQGHVVLNPGQILEMDVVWDLNSNDGELLAPGTYLVSVDDKDIGEPWQDKWTATLVELTIAP